MENQLEQIAIGSPAPGFRLVESTGIEIKLTDFRSKQAIVLFFVREFI